MADAEHESLLRGGVEGWNAWRRKCSEIPDLRGAVFERLDLRKADLSHVEFAGAEFRDCLLSFAIFESAKLQVASFSGTSPCQVNFHFAEMGGCKLTRCEFRSADIRDANLPEAKFEESRFIACNFTNANLAGSVWLDCSFEKCNLRDADLGDSSFERNRFGPMQPNKMKQSILTNVNFARADLRGLVGYQFDHNNFQGTLLAPRAVDDWSVLRRTYTGSRLLFNLIFLLCFFAPVVAKTIFWMEVSRIESQVPAALAELNRLSDALEVTAGKVGHDMAQALGRAVAEAPILHIPPGTSASIPLDYLLLKSLAGRLTIQPGTVARLLGESLESALADSAPTETVRQLVNRLADELARRPEAEAKRMADALRSGTAALPTHLPRPSSLLISVVLGLGVSWREAGISGIVGAIAGILLIVYNAARGVLTYFVTQLRDEEQVTAHTPKRSGLLVRREPDRSQKCPRVSAWLHSCTATLRNLPAALKEQYGWLMWPQRIVFWLQYLAYGMSAIHLYNIATGTVFLPT